MLGKSKTISHPSQGIEQIFGRRRNLHVACHQSISRVTVRYPEIDRWIPSEAGSIAADEDRIING